MPRGLMLSLFMSVLLVHVVQADLKIGTSFQAGTITTAGGFIPPDTMGAVGPEHVVELINGRYGVYRKSDGALLRFRSLNTFWTLEAGTTVTGFAFDPRVLYDAESERFFAVAVESGFSVNSAFLFAVSISSDPLDGWVGFSIDADTDNQHWADFPTLGLDANGLYVCANMAPLGVIPTTVNALILPKSDLLLPVPTIANRTFLESVDSMLGQSIQPVVDFDRDIANKVPFLSEFSIELGLVSRSTLTGRVTNPELAFTAFIGVDTYDDPPDAPQPPIPFQKQDIETGTARFSGNVILRHGRLWAVQAVDFQGRGAVRFLHIDRLSNIVVQDSLISDPELHLSFPSIAVNEFKQVVVGFSGSSETQPISAYVTVGTTVASVTTFEPLQMIREGLDDYELLDGSSRNRWGDYSATVVDPEDESVFWTFQEFVVADDIWAIQVVQLFAEPMCIEDFADPPGDVGFAELVEVLASWGPCKGCPADLDDNGMVDFNDLVQVLANWGPCP